VHHVASVYPIEIELAQTIAGGKPVVGVTSEVINSMNASHAEQNRDVTRDEALALLRRNSEVAAAAIRSLTEEDLNRAAPVSLYWMRRSHVSSSSRITLFATAIITSRSFARR
jgi:hypothetical protein